MVKCIFVAVNETAVGHVSAYTEQFLQSCNGSSFVTPDVTLFATNMEVDLYNSKRLAEMPGQEHLFQSIDTGSAELLNKIGTPKVKWWSLKMYYSLLINVSE